MRTDRLTVKVEVELFGRLHSERLKRIAVLSDRLFILSRTALFHRCVRGTMHRHQAGIGTEAQHEKEYEEYAG